MTFDMNDAELPRGTDLIPDGSFVKLRMEIRKGGIDGASPFDRELLKAAKTPGSDVRMLDCEFTVVAGPHSKRKIWQSFTVTGGKADMVALARGLLYDPRWAWHAAETLGADAAYPLQYERSRPAKWPEAFRPAKAAE